MNAHQAKQYLPLIQALAEGRRIERRIGAEKSIWTDCADPRFEDWPLSDFRVKPEPRDFWITWDVHNAHPIAVYNHPVETFAGHAIIHVREVL